MTRLTRTLALSVCVFSLLLGSVKVATATTTGINATAGAGVYKEKSNIDKSVSKTLQAVSDSETKGTPSLNSLIDDTSLSWQTSLFLNIAGVPDDSSALTGMSEEQKRFISERYGHGVIGQVGQGIIALYSPPASAQTYLADVMHSAHIIPQAQAQGLGFASLNPILGTWKIFRNVAYLFFVIIFLVIGFMIMFRQKIGGQTVVTAQQAIPGVIISLIFVTFSYAIAGFMIDLMYLLMYLMVGLFNAGGGTELLSKNIFGVGLDLIVGKDNVFSTVNTAVSALVSSINTDTVGDVLSWIGGITLGLVVSIAVLIGIFKLFFELLKTYITLIVSIVTAPLLLMIGAIPGKSNFGSWIKTLVGNLLAFPVVLMALIFYYMFTANDLGAGGFVPPFLIGRGNGSVVVTLVGIGIILIIPDIIKEMKKAFGAEGGIFETLAGKMIDQAREGVPLGTKIVGTGIGAGLGAVGGLGQGIWETQGTRNLGVRLGRILQFTGRGAGNLARGGARAGGSVSTAIGGRTPEAIQFVEHGVDAASGWMSDDERLRRIEERRDFLGRSTGNRVPFEQRRELAERKADKARFEEERLRRGQYGELVTTSREQEGGEG